MNKNDLQAIGFDEMSMEEVQDTNGGSLIRKWAPFLMKEFISFCEGYVDHARRHPDMSETLMNCM